MILLKNSIKLEEAVMHELRELYRKYGYTQFKMRKFEPYDLYMQNKEFPVSDGIITSTDNDGVLMALKPDVTLSIVKNFRKENAPMQKVCYCENVYRSSGAGHNYREIMQTGLECLGDIGLYEITEVLNLAAQSLRTISENYVLEISHMGILYSVLAQMSVKDDALSAVLNHIGEKNKDALIAECGLENAQKLLALMDISGPIKETLPALSALAEGEALCQLQELTAALDHDGAADHIHLDFSIVSNRNYYNDFVFRGYIEGIPSVVLAGGQYDRLMDKMAKDAGGIGFAVYLDQLEQFKRRDLDYDIDTIVIYDDTTDLICLRKIADSLSDAGVLMTKTVPLRTRYRKLVKLENGRLTTIEENG